MAVTYTPEFRHKDWVDNVDRVRAAGDNGFNVRFHALEAEFARIADIMDKVSDALDALSQTPVPKPVKLTLTPTLITLTDPWNHVFGGADKPSGATDASGMMSVTLPHGATIRELRACGRKDSGNLSVNLRRAEPGRRVHHRAARGPDVEQRQLRLLGRRPRGSGVEGGQRSVPLLPHRGARRRGLDRGRLADLLPDHLCPVVTVIDRRRGVHHDQSARRPLHQVRQRRRRQRRDPPKERRSGPHLRSGSPIRAATASLTRSQAWTTGSTSRWTA
ncbi:hypothetical protein ACFSTC_03405 [Nonomuraea ferruginea]